MLKLIKYDLKKHIKVALILAVLIVISIVINHSMVSSINPQNESIIIDISQSFLVLVIIYLMIFAIVVYFIHVGNEFNNTVQSGERFLYFTLPLRNGKLLMSKFIAAFIGGLIILAAYIIGNQITILMDKSGVLANNLPSGFLGGTFITEANTLITLILYAIVFYFMIVGLVMLLKPLTKRRSFKYLWVLPAAMGVILFSGITFTVFENSISNFIYQEAKSLPWDLWITLILVAFFLFVFDRWYMKKKLDL